VFTRIDWDGVDEAFDQGAVGGLRKFAQESV
jgi:hypothetical protein